MIGVPRDAIKLCARFEGFRACPYRDPVGIWTIGYGETQGIGPNTPCWSKRKARARLKARLRSDFLPALREQIDGFNRLPRGARAALLSWVYNLGPAALASSTLRVRLNRGENPCTVISQEFPKWVRAGGNVLPGLVRRRKAEIRVACGGE